MYKAFTIAGSDSGGGAGIQADLKTFAACGVYGTSALTAVTAQNTLGVHSFAELSPEIVAAQIDAVMDDIEPQAVKTGMVASPSIVERLVERLHAHRVEQLVVDPVMVAASGDPLLRPAARVAVEELLIPLARLVTPNIPEATALSGMKIERLPDIKKAALRIHRLGCQAVLITGGHLLGGPEAVDVLYDGSSYRTFRAPKVETENTHGTGCTFSAAITAGLARGNGLAEAIQFAKEYVTGAIRQAIPVGRGRGPTHHFWQLYERAQIHPEVKT